MAKETFFSLNAGFITLAMFSAAQENIPDAAPIADGPLVANPEQDTLDMADMLYKQAPVSYTHLDVYKRQYIHNENCLSSFIDSCSRGGRLVLRS